MINAISVKDRLKNRAVASGKTMQEMLIAFGLERTIYRISVSQYKDHFILKGGIFLYALWEGRFARATRDIDLLAKNIPNDINQMHDIFTNILSVECDDALIYDLATLEVQNITELKEYHGVNITVTAYLDRTRIPISIDIGFGDAICPAKVEMDFPVLLDMNVPKIYAYSIYSVISEKFEAIVSLGKANSRYKDFYDIYLLATSYSLDSILLKEAITETFEHRGTGFDDIIVFTEEFSGNELHRNRWNAFLKKKKALVSISFDDVINLTKALLEPVVFSTRNGNDLGVWSNSDMAWLPKV